MKPSAMAYRFACCEHCPTNEGCPRAEGHAGACRVQGCPSNEPLYGDDPVFDEDVVESVSDTLSFNFHLEEQVEKMRDDVVKAAISVVGYEPPGLRVLIRTLSHPDVATYAREYFDAIDVASRCTKYEPPWNCAREAESQYRNIQHGWLGAANGIGFDESWCEACRKKIMGD